MDKTLLYVLAAIATIVIIIIVVVMMKDPCKDFSNDQKGVSLECYQQIWKEAGCINPKAAEDNMKSYPAWFAGQTKVSLAGDSKAWATMTDDKHRIGCYTMDKSKWPK